MTEGRDEDNQPASHENARSLACLAVILAILATVTLSFAAILYLPVPLKILAAVPPVLYRRYVIGEGWLESCVGVVIMAVVIGVLLAVLIPVVRALKQKVDRGSAAIRVHEQSLLRELGFDGHVLSAVRVVGHGGGAAAMETQIVSVR